MSQKSIDKIKISTVFAAVSDKSILDPLLDVLATQAKGQTLNEAKPGKRSGLRLDNQVCLWGTQGTVDYIKSKGFSAQSVVSGFDFDGRVKSLGRTIFARILADRTNKKHLEELQRLTANTSEVKPGRFQENSSEVKDPAAEPFDLVVVDLYKLEKSNFPESMDIGGQALIRAAIKNYVNVVVAYDASSLESLVRELVSNNGSTTLEFRKTQAQKAAKFIAERTSMESFLL